MCWNKWKKAYKKECELHNNEVKLYKQTIELAQNTNKNALCLLEKYNEENEMLWSAVKAVNLYRDNIEPYGEVIIVGDLFVKKGDKDYEALNRVLCYIENKKEVKK